MKIVSTIACIGGAHIDRRAMLRGPLVLGTSNPGTVYSDLGGVARNVAQNLARLGCPVLLCSRVGDDEPGRHVLSQPLDTSLITVSSTRPTASYTAILETTGELVIGLADMDVYDEVTPAVLASALPRLREAALWFIDTNLPGDTVSWLLDAAPVPVAVDAISVAKSRRLLPLLPRIPYLFCNLAQAAALAGAPLPGLSDAVDALTRLGASAGIVSAGARGIAVYDSGGMVLLPALPAVPRDVTGAGDALVSGVLYGLSQHQTLRDAARWGLAAAAIAVESESSAAPTLTLEALHARA
ncbi:MAG TPA: carbohydrate kinase family protein [Candidatus Sulfopaludibacter sp.]|jgi:pseudouridine kinase|nr:carbohydrate kinase family protein [Candidatus Sulfopaludibacter sp.]